MSIKARIECLNHFLKELITLDAKLECFSNFFNKDYTEVNDEFERNSFTSDSKNITLHLSEFVNKDENDNISISDNDTLCEVESVSHMSSTSSNSVLVVNEDGCGFVPSGVIQHNIKLTAKYKFISTEDNVTW